MRVRLFIAFLGVLLTVLFANGHQSPVHVVDALSSDMANQGITVKGLIARGYEYQALGDWNAAAADFSAAVALDPHSRPALIGCVEALLQVGALIQAEAMSRRGLAFDEDVSGKAPFFALLARVFDLQNRWPESLDAWREALKSAQPEIDWFLGEANSLARLGRNGERVEALSRAIRRNPSIVLQRAWIRALVDAGDLEEALREIEFGIAQSRWQGSWLLLRAEVRGQQGLHAEKQVDASAAFTELQSRLSPGHPDPFLVKEAALALGLMGQREDALLYLELARNLGVSEAELATVEKWVR